MRSTRVVPGRPVNGGAVTVQKIRDLILDTLDQSDSIDLQQAGGELGHVTDLVGLLALGGHLRERGLVLVSGGLQLTILVPVGEAALSTTEDVRPPRLARSAADWMLHLPATDGFAAAIAEAAEACDHISNKNPPDDPPGGAEQESANNIDLTRLSRLRATR